jgi:hypothetical protein
LKRVVLMVCIDMNVLTSIQHISILFESFNDGKKFFLTYGVVALCYSTCVNSIQLGGLLA